MFTAKIPYIHLKLLNFFNASTLSYVYLPEFHRGGSQLSLEKRTQETFNVLSQQQSQILNSGFLASSQFILSVPTSLDIGLWKEEILVMLWGWWQRPKNRWIGQPPISNLVQSSVILQTGYYSWTQLYSSFFSCSSMWISQIILICVFKFYLTFNFL